MASSGPYLSRRTPAPSSGLVLVVLAGMFGLATLVLIWAVALAGRTFEPWGDSPRVLYAVVGDVLLGTATTLIALAVRQSRRHLRAWRIPRWLEFLIYIASCVAIAVPLSIAATNSVEASSMGEGGPSFSLVALGGASLAAALALLIRRSVRHGLTLAIVLGTALTTYAMIAAR
jgi:hypothetical protein